MLAHLVNLPLRLAPLGHVGGDLPETDQPAILVVNCIEDGQRPEPGPILADAPALILKPTRAAGGIERQCRLTGPPILFGKEGREMPAQNLVGIIALDAPSAAVPTADPAFGVQHVDGIVDDGIDQEFKSLRAAEWPWRFIHLYHPRMKARAAPQRASTDVYHRLSLGSQQIGKSRTRRVAH